MCKMEAAVVKKTRVNRKKVIEETKVETLKDNII